MELDKYKQELGKFEREIETTSNSLYSILAQLSPQLRKEIDSLIARYNSLSQEPFKKDTPIPLTLQKNTVLHDILVRKSKRIELLRLLSEL